MNLSINKVKCVLKSIFLIFLLMYFSSFVFAIFNVDPEKVSTNEYSFYLFISNLLMLGIFIFIYKDTLKKDFKDYIKNLGTNMETSIKYWLVGFGIMALSNIFITYIL